MKHLTPKKTSIIDVSGPELERRNPGNTLQFIIPLPASLTPWSKKTISRFCDRLRGEPKKGMIRLVIVEDDPGMPTAA
jgi:hypothetical protein